MGVQQRQCALISSTAWLRLEPAFIAVAAVDRLRMPWPNHHELELKMGANQGGRCTMS